jgi:peptide/nickel transport system ATP-binding protein
VLARRRAVSELTIEGLRVVFGPVHALDGVDLHVPTGGTVGLVGESGPGKSTLARAIVQLVRPAGGRVLLDGEDVTRARGERLRALRRRAQMVFQDPSASLDPRMTAAASIAEAVTTHHALRGPALAAEVARLLDLVGLADEIAGRYPHEVSGGQRQRIAIARALAVRPDILILDEVTSALDVSVQATILNLLRELQTRLGLTFLFISHNLATVRYMSDRIAVMYLGCIVEDAPADAFFARPRHPYARVLIDAVPRAGAPLAVPLSIGEPPDPRNPPPGCRFHPRCPIGPVGFPDRAICATADPQPLLRDPAARAACHYAGV